MKALTNPKLPLPINKLYSVLQIKRNSLPIEFDFLQSDDPKTIETGIKQNQKNLDFRREINALAIYKFFDESLFIELGMSRENYLEQSEERLSLTKQQVSDYILSGEMLFTFIDEFRKRKYKTNKHYSKLVLLNRAVNKRQIPTEEALDNFFDMSYRGFKEWLLKPETESGRPDYTQGNNSAAISEKGITINGELKVSVAQIQKIIDSGNNPFVVSLQSEGEKRVISKALKDFRGGKNRLRG